MPIDIVSSSISVSNNILSKKKYCGIIDRRFFPIRIVKVFLNFSSNLFVY